MPWNDDSWRDSYDDPEPAHHCEMHCLRDDGAAECPCGETWWPTRTELVAFRAQQAEHLQWERRERRRAIWRKVTNPIRWPLYRLLTRLGLRKAHRVLLDEDIPF